MEWMNTCLNHWKIIVSMYLGSRHYSFGRKRKQVVSGMDMINLLASKPVAPASRKQAVRSVRVSTHTQRESVLSYYFRHSARYKESFSSSSKFQCVASDHWEGAVIAPCWFSTYINRNLHQVLVISVGVFYVYQSSWFSPVSVMLDSTSSEKPQKNAKIITD